MYTITYRKSNGSTERTTITASSSTEARALFLARFDGRIITIDQN